MRLHRLEVNGFGPFAGNENIDFDEVVRQGLFLLHGQTGAGKTSLLDAICFALFGSVPGARSRTERLASDHSPTGTKPQVVCEFTAAGRRLKVSRSPAWERPRSRGTGTTTDKAQVLVQEWVAGAWVPLAQRADEAGQVLTDVLGMGKDQFTKVILLPQGDFAAFLRASPDERRTLLEKLFGTARFSRMEDWLAGARNEAKAELHEQDGLRSDLVARADERAESIPGIDRTERLALAALPPDAVGDASLEMLSRWQRRGAQADCDAHERARATAEAGRAAQAHADAATDRVLRTSSLCKALQDHHDQLAAADARHASLERLRRAELAERVRSRLHSIDEAAVALQRARDSVRRAHDRVRSIELVAARKDAPSATVHDSAGQLSFDLDSVATQPPEIASTADDLTRVRLDDEIAARRAVISRIDELAAEDESLATAQAAARASTRQLELLVQRRSTLIATIRTARQLLGDLGMRRESLLPLAAALDERRAAHELARLRCQAAQQAVALRQDVTTATDRHQRCVDNAQLARARHLTLVQRRLDGMAAELASQLVDGDACPVCGAAEHPRPAVGADLVAAPTVEAAATRATRLQQGAEQAAAERAGLREALAAAESVAAGLTVAEATEKLGVAHRAQAEAAAAGDTLAKLDAELATRSSAVADAETEADDLNLLREQVQQELSRQEARVAEGVRVVQGVRGPFGTLGERRLAVVAEQELLCTLANALDEEQGAQAILDSALVAADTDCAAIGFTNRGAASQALLAESQQRLLAAEIDAGAKAAAAAASRLADDDLCEAAQDVGLLVTPWPPTSVQVTAAALETATLRQADLTEVARLAEEAAATRGREATEATARAAQIRPAAAAMAQLAGQLRTVVDAMAPLHERAAILEELASTAQGISASNTRKLRLAAFVLEARLEQVAEAASQRLQHMSWGRYTLLHSESRGKGTGRSGLGLRVMDAWTSLPRDTNSLSGGEAFLASLALALGLADVVQAEAGGIAIETLFIDEGFGTLDEETLELVMEVLDQLREGGRAVGVVSHVGELRSRIPSQLQVVKGHRGSRVVVTEQLAS